MKLKDVQSSSQIVTTNKPTPNFLQAVCPSRCPTYSFRAHSTDLLIPNSPGVFQLVFTTEDSWLPWRRVAKYLSSTLMPVPHLLARTCITINTPCESILLHFTFTACTCYSIFTLIEPVLARQLGPVLSCLFLK